MADTFWGNAADDMHKTAVAKAHSFATHPSAEHFKNAAKHFKKASDVFHSGGDDAEIAKHWDRGDKHMSKGEKMTLESENLDEIAKATLDRYRLKAKERFRAKGGINAALDKQDKKEQPRKKAANEDIEQLDELSPKTLKSYAKKAGGYGRRSGWGLAQKGEKEEDKSMSTDGNKYPEKQERHQKAASKLYHKSNNRDKGVEAAKKRLRKEGLSVVDRVMVDDQPDASVYIEDIELRCNSLVDEKKEELRKTLFDFSENEIVDEARKPKPGSPGGSWVDRDVADRFKKEAKEKKQFASAKREINDLKKKGK